jgi:hypothetical protein
MKLDSKFAIPPQVMARTVGAETVILHLESGTYFGLDPVSARIWQLIEKGKSLAEVCDAMVEEYDVSRDVLERDALGLVRDLVEKKLVTAA